MADAGVVFHSAYLLRLEEVSLRVLLNLPAVRSRACAAARGGRTSTTPGWVVPTPLCGTLRIVKTRWRNLARSSKEGGKSGVDLALYAAWRAAGRTAGRASTLRCRARFLKNSVSMHTQENFAKFEVLDFRPRAPMYYKRYLVFL